MNEIPHRHLRRDGRGYVDHRHVVRTVVHSHEDAMPTWLPRAPYSPAPLRALRRPMAVPRFQGGTA